MNNLSDSERTFLGIHAEKHLRLLRDFYRLAMETVCLEKPLQELREEIAWHEHLCGKLRGPAQIAA